MHESQHDAPSHQTVIGRLEGINGSNGLTGSLREPNGTQWICHFKPHHRHLLAAAWLNNVRVVGLVTKLDTAEQVLEVNRIELVDQAATSVEGQSFWSSRSIEELAEEQGVAIAPDLDEISRLWPVDDDPDALLRHVLNERKARRTLINQR